MQGCMKLQGQTTHLFFNDAHVLPFEHFSRSKNLSFLLCQSVPLCFVSSVPKKACLGGFHVMPIVSCESLEAPYLSQIVTCWIRAVRETPETPCTSHLEYPRPPPSTSPPPRLPTSQQYQQRQHHPHLHHQLRTARTTQNSELRCRAARWPFQQHTHLLLGKEDHGRVVSDPSRPPLDDDSRRQPVFLQLFFPVNPSRRSENMESPRGGRANGGRIVETK